jgi:hypothetical protein
MLSIIVMALGLFAASVVLFVLILFLAIVMHGGPPSNGSSN